MFDLLGPKERDLYIRALWVSSRDGSKRGVNVGVYLHPEGLPQDWKLQNLIENPGKEPVAQYLEVSPSGENHVETAMDLVLEDRVFNQDDLILALDEMASKNTEEIVNLMPWTVALPKGKMYGQFIYYPGPIDRVSARVLFNLLRDAILAALKRLPSS